MSRTPNDDRSDSKNPNNPAFDHSQDNRANHLNPEHEHYQAPNQDQTDTDKE